MASLTKVTENTFKNEGDSQYFLHASSKQQESATVPQRVA